MRSEEREKPRSIFGWVLAGVVALGLMGLFLWSLAPSSPWGKARESARRCECKNNLKQMGLALHRYSSQHEGKFPSGETAAEVMRELIGEGYIKEEVRFWQLPVFVCPSAKADVKAWKRLRKLTEETCSYEFVTGLSADSDGDLILAYDRTPHWGGGRNVLFVDGHVEWRLEPGFQKSLAEEREMMKEQGRMRRWRGR